METNNDYDFQNFLKEMESQNFSEEYDLIINRVIYEFKQMKSQIIAETIETTKKHYETEIEKLKLRIAQLEQTDYQRQINELVHIIYELKKTIEETKMEVNCFKVKNTPVDIPKEFPKNTTTNNTTPINPTGKNSYEVSFTPKSDAKGKKVIDSGEGGTNITWKLFNDGSLSFKGSGAIYTFKNPRDCSWMRAKDKATSIVIHSGITIIGERAFKSFSELRSVIMHKSVEIIGNSAFHSCKKLSEVSFPDSLVRIDDGSFSACSMLTQIVISSNKLTFIGNSCFQGCSTLAKVDISGSKLAVIGNSCFQECSNLREVLLTNTSLKEIRDSCFKDCQKLSYVALPDSLEKIGYECFCNDINVYTITLGKNIKSIGSDAFKYWTSMQKIILQSRLTSKKEVSRYWKDDCYANIIYKSPFF